MPHGPQRGLLDRLDAVDRLLVGVNLGGHPDRRALREAHNRIKNARLELNEIRRLIERVGDETKT